MRILIDSRVLRRLARRVRSLRFRAAAAAVGAGRFVRFRNDRGNGARHPRRSQADSSALHDDRAVRGSRKSSTRRARAVARTLQERMARYGTSAEYIARRQVSVLTSRFVKHDPDSRRADRRYGDLRNPTGETLDERMNLFEEVACDVFERVYRDPELPPPDDILHVSCSGYVSPSPVQSFLSRRGWLGVGVTHSYHMGCYGAFPGNPHRAGPGRLVVRFAAESQATRRSRPYRVPLAPFRSARRRAR